MTRPSLTTLILNIPSIQRCFKQFEHRDVTIINIYTKKVQQQASAALISAAISNTYLIWKYGTKLFIFLIWLVCDVSVTCISQLHIFAPADFYVKSCVSECPRCVWLLVFIGPIVWPQNQHPPPPANDNHNYNPGPVSRLKPGSLWRLSLANQRPASGSRDQHWPIRGQGAAREIVTSNYHGRGENFKGLEDD